MRPPSPVRLAITWDPTGNLLCTWVRRSSKGWSWLDGVDAPLGSSTELYRATLTGWIAAIELSSEHPRVEFTAQQVAAIGLGEAELFVVQVGDLAVSRPANLSITINQD